ncbi:MAG TPA: hypothetical protein VM165_12325 [Planctomycetaceae bacterium]|nr:hypothetical protein [Planctomycetaceae bacterium]
MANTLRTLGMSCLVLVVDLMVCCADEPASAPTLSPSLRAALAHMTDFQFSESRAAGKSPVEMSRSPLLTFGDAARNNESGTLWMWGRGGRPLAMLELFRPSGENQSWVHAVTSTSPRLGKLDDSAGHRWTPRTSHFSLAEMPDSGEVATTSQQRLRRMKELSRRFSAHQFWDQNNSRYELRLLVQPVHRYRDDDAHVLDGAVFVLAHGTNPEVLLQIEAQATDPQPVWQYSLARLGSAEMHVQLDGREVWTVQRTPGVVGQPDDPYWLFVTPAKPVSVENPKITP